jgi:hypothetical protein
LAEIISGYAESLRKSGDLPQAESFHREALEIRSMAFDEHLCTELDLAVSYTQLGCTLAGMNQFGESYKYHDLALKLRYRHLDFPHGLISESMNYCAESLFRIGRGVEGIPLAIHSCQARKQVFSETHPAYAHSLSVLASCYHSVGRFLDAESCIKNCLNICEKAFHKNHANLIPNLIPLHGDILLCIGNFKQARVVYERAYAIHQVNFKGSKQIGHMEMCLAGISKACAGRLSRKVFQKSSPIKDNITPLSIESDGTPVIVFTDIGRDVDDELALVLLSALRRKRLLDPIAIITTLLPEQRRAYLARGSMDILGMADIPVGIGSSGGVSEDIEVEVYDAHYSRASPSIYESGMELVYKALESVPPKSAQLLCLASLTDVATLIREQEELFTSKVKEVIFMGGVVSLESEMLTPDSAYNNNCDISSARFVYKRCQELRIPTATLSRWAAYGCPIPPKLLDELSKTEHMVSVNVRGVSKLGIDQLWNKVTLHPSDPRREMLPARCDVNWFCRVFMSKKEVNREWPSSVWSLVTKLNMYDPLAVLLCVPAYRTSHFTWQTKVVNGTSHIVVGTSELDTGIQNRLLLFNEYSTLFFSAFLESLHK